MTPKRKSRPEEQKGKGVAAYVEALHTLTSYAEVEPTLAAIESYPDSPERRELARRCYARMAATEIGEYLADCYGTGNPSIEQRRVLRQMFALLKPSLARHKDDKDKDARIQRALRLVRASHNEVETVVVELATLAKPELVDLRPDELAWAADVLRTYSPSRNPPPGRRSANGVLAVLCRRWRLFGFGPSQSIERITRAISQSSRRNP